jgi:hypothetical protein
VYYPISLEHTEFHSLYGEAVNKTFLPPIRVYALIAWEGAETKTTDFIVDKMASLTVNFHRRRLTEDQNLFVREGDFVLYGGYYYEISELKEPRELFGQNVHRFEVSARCIRAREGLFDAT